MICCNFITLYYYYLSSLISDVTYRFPFSIKPIHVTYSQTSLLCRSSCRGLSDLILHILTLIFTVQLNSLILSSAMPSKYSYFYITHSTSRSSFGAFYVFTFADVTFTKMQLSSSVFCFYISCSYLRVKLLMVHNLTSSICVHSLIT